MSRVFTPEIRKILAVVACFVMIATVFAGCGSDKKEQEAGADQSVAESSSKTEPVTEKVTVPNVTTPYSTDGAVPTSPENDGSYFDDAVFVGDSISLKLKYYEAAHDRLGKAQFLTSGSLSADQLLKPISSETVHVKFNDEEMYLEDAIPLTGAKKMYIMLGMNDIGLGMDEGIEHYTEVIRRVLEKSPDLKIFIQSVTPRLSPTTTKAITNAKIKEYNKRLSALCAENGWYFIDVASVMYGDNGCLKSEYCSDPDDMGMHFTDEGCSVWADYLLTHVVE